MSDFTVRRLGYALGASIEGLDLTQPISESVAARIRQAWLENIVLCFPAQKLDGTGLRKFAGLFGELYDNRSSPQNRLPGDDAAITFFTAKPIVVAGVKAGGLRNGIWWHTDGSFTERPNPASFLMAKELPKVGGDTIFSNTYMAYDTLSPKMQEICAQLRGVHDITMSDTYPRQSPEAQEQDRRLNPLVVHPVVTVHPETGKKTLYLGNRIRHFVGMTAEESAPLLDYLNDHCHRYEFLYRHRWTVGDVVMWDNRCAQHRAIEDFDLSEQRYMLRCALNGPKVGAFLDELSERELAASSTR